MSKKNVYASIDELKASVDKATEQELPPGYIIGFDLEVQDGRIYCGPGIANVNGKKVTLTAGRLILDSEWVSKSKVASKIYYIYYTTGAAFFVDLNAPAFSATNFGYYHPTLGYRYIGKARTDKAGAIDIVANHMNIIAENISFEEIDGDRVKANTITSKQMVIGDATDTEGDPIPDGAELFRYDSAACTSHEGRKPVTKVIKYEQGLIGAVANPWFKERRWTVGKGLVVAYTMDAGFGAELRDDSGNFYDATISGAVWSSSGHSGYCLDFDGTNDIVTIPGTFVGRYSEAKITMIARAKSDKTDYSIHGKLIITYVSSGVGGMQLAAVGNPAKWRFYYVKTGGTTTYIESTTAVSTAAFQTVVGTMNGTAVKLYVDGVEEATANDGEAYTVSGTFYASIGAHTTPNQFFDGKIDDVRVYNRALTAAEVTAHYTETTAYEDVESAPCDNAIWAGKTTTNLVLTTDMSDSTKWNINATYQSGGANMYDQELGKTVYKWTKGSDATASFLLCDGMLSSPAAGNYVQSIMVKCNYDINVIPYLNGTTPGALLAGGVFVPANTWTLVSTRVTTAVTTYTDIRWAFRLPGGGNFAADIEFRAVDPYCAAESYPMPFAATTRPVHNLYYNFSWAQQGTLGLWIKPQFNHTNSPANVIILNNDHAGADISRIVLFYDITNDRFEIALYDNSGNANSAYTEAISTNEVLKKWWFIAATYDIPNDSLKIYAYSSDYPTGMSVTNSTADLGTNTLTNKPFLDVGRKYTSSPTTADSFIAGLFYDDTVWTAEALQAHYDSGRVYYDPESIFNYEKGVYIDKSGIDIKNGGIDIIDNYGREIDISNSSGLLARDASGRIVHDIIKNASTQDIYYMGHYYHIYAPGSENLLYYSAAFVPYVWTEITAKLFSCDNIKGVRLGIWAETTGTSADNNSRMMVSGRPYGSSWDWTYSQAPAVGIDAEFSSDVVVKIDGWVTLDIPLGEDNKVEIFARMKPYGSPTGIIYVHEIGLWA